MGQRMSAKEIVSEYCLSLSVDFLELDMAQCVFDQHQLAHNGCLLEVPGIVTCLFTVYSELQQMYPDMINIPLCVDLCLNWLLNVYDRYVKDNQGFKVKN